MLKKCEILQFSYFLLAEKSAFLVAMDFLREKKCQNKACRFTKVL